MIRKFVFIIMLFFLYSCSENSQNTNAIVRDGKEENDKVIEYKDLSRNSKANTLPIRIRVGTHLANNCTGNHPCGPCPGICIQFGKPKKEPKPPKLLLVDYNQGDRIVWISKISDAQVELIFTAPDHDIDGVVILETSYSLGEEISFDLGFSNTVSLESGQYVLDYSEYQYGKGIFNVITDN